MNSFHVSLFPCCASRMQNDFANMETQKQLSNTEIKTKC